MALTEPARMVKSARTAFEIIEYIHEQDGAKIGELAEYLDLAKSTVHGYLATLEALEYLVTNGTTYNLSLKFLYHGTAARNSIPLSGLADETLAALAEATSLVAWLVVEEHGRAVYLDRAVGDETVQSYGRISKRTDLHSSASGKAILAHLPDSTVRKVLDSYGLAARTEYTITDEAALFEELAAVREQGYAESKHEVALGIYSVAAPVRHDGQVLGAVSVSGTSNQVDEAYFDTELPELVRSAADELTAEYARHYD
jgi:DNA-binding IclR family transcriptional regulator